jgi:hypothetical protein
MDFIAIPARACYWFSVTYESGLQQVLLVVPSLGNIKEVNVLRKVGVTA